MKRPAATRKALGIVAISAVVFAAGAAAAWSSPTTTTSTTTTTTASGSLPGADPNSPAAHYFVINGTANAASDHEILGSSAFPNYTTGAVDNYYSKAHTHVDNAPFAEGTASPADTGPVGQTAAAGNFQQPQYADARWPGDPGKASYGSQGGPYAVADASEYTATAEASEASSGLSGPSGTSEMAVPKGFNGRLRTALAAWKAKWLDRLHPKKSKATVPTPTATVTTPAVTVTTPAGAVTTPTVPLGSLTIPPSATVPSAAVPSGITPKSSSSRSLQSSPGDGASLLHSTTQTMLDPKTDALVTTGESSLGRVGIGGGQIVLEGIHVSAQITNDGTPTDKEAISVASASIGGIPVTIDQDGVHVAGQGQNLPYQQASDALNAALKQAGIQVFLVAPEITRGGSSGQPGTTTTTSPIGPMGSTTTTGTTTTTTSTDQTDTTTTTSSSVGTCEPTATTSTDGTDTTTDTTSTTTTGTTTTTGPVLPIGTTTTSSGNGTGTTTDTTSEETVTATGVHVVFTQPVDPSGVPAQYAEHILGEVYVDSLAVPAGSLPNLGLDLNSSSSSSPCGLTGRHSGKKSKSVGAAKIGGGSSAGGSTSFSSSSPSGSGSPSGFTSGSGSSQPTSGLLSGSASQPISSSTGNAVPTSATGFLSTLRKPLWLLIAYLLWQALMLVTGVSVWHWYRGAAS